MRLLRLAGVSSVVALIPDVHVGGACVARRGAGVAEIIIDVLTRELVVAGILLLLLVLVWPRLPHH